MFYTILVNADTGEQALDSPVGSYTFRQHAEERCRKMNSIPEVRESGNRWIVK